MKVEVLFWQKRRKFKRFKSVSRHFRLPIEPGLTFHHFMSGLPVIQELLRQFLARYRAAKRKP